MVQDTFKNYGYLCIVKALTMNVRDDNYVLAIEAQSIDMLGLFLGFLSSTSKSTLLLL